MLRRVLVGSCIGVLALPVAAQTRPVEPAADLAQAIRSVLGPLATDKPYDVSVEVSLSRKGERQRVAVSVGSDGRGGLNAVIESPWASLLLVRNDSLLMVLRTDRKVAFCGEGPPANQDLLTAGELGRRISAIVSKAAGGLPWLLNMAGFEPAESADASVRSYRIGEQKPARGVTAHVDVATGRLASVRYQRGQDLMTIKVTTPDRIALETKPDLTNVKRINVPRHELERTLARGIVRAVSILYDDAFWMPLPTSRKAVEHGTLEVRGGHRILLLSGTPDEIGHAHGQLLRDEAMAVMDSVLNVVGLAYSFEKGVWFLDELRAARKRLWPHVPEEYKQEMAGFARGAGAPLETVELGNLFPEMFHCSGFAVFGSATKDGKLYHGRVLDYMTRVGLHRNAALVVVRKPGRLGIANVGYAGFIGSVTGMNEKQLAIGEMGGRGEGNWDGMPMSILVRHALETCPTLDDACKLFERTPRTCEYYYVFSDGKIPDARGVAATPGKIAFLRPGESHELLPRPVKDAVLMSAGSRYDHLVDRVEQGFGRIDARMAMDFMKRPVAMNSNLHDVLFVPQDLRLYVANAAGFELACDQPYVEYDLAELLKALPAK